MNPGEVADPEEPVAAAFSLIADVAEATAEDSRALAQQARHAERDRAEGASVGSMVADGRPQRILRLAEDVATRLLGASSGLRKALLRGLSSEGAGVSAMARHFGVSHQRISTLLRGPGRKGKR